MIQSAYSSALTVNSQRYGREGCKSSNYYYEAIQVNVMTSGSYLFSSSSNINAYGYLYKDRFNPLNAAQNFLAENDEGCENGQFQLVVDLEPSETYILVVTTYPAEITGKFLIFGSGPDKINFNRISEYN